MNAMIDNKNHDADRSVTVDMATHFDASAEAEKLLNARFAMQPVVVAAFRQAAQLAAARLLSIMSDDSKFNKLSPKDQAKFMELIFDRAYGKSETASTSTLTDLKTGQGANHADHGNELRAIEARAMERARRNGPARIASDKPADGAEGEGDGGLMGGAAGSAFVGEDVLYPELELSQRAKGQAQRNRSVTDRGEVVPIRRGRS